MVSEIGEDINLEGEIIKEDEEQVRDGAGRQLDYSSNIHSIKKCCAFVPHSVLSSGITVVNRVSSWPYGAHNTVEEIGK